RGERDQHGDDGAHHCGSDARVQGNRDHRREEWHDDHTATRHRLHHKTREPGEACQSETDEVALPAGPRPARCSCCTRRGSRHYPASLTRRTTASRSTSLRAWHMSYSVTTSMDFFVEGKSSAALRSSTSTASMIPSSRG